MYRRVVVWCGVWSVPWGCACQWSVTGTRVFLWTTDGVRCIGSRMVLRAGLCMLEHRARGEGSGAAWSASGK